MHWLFDAIIIIIIIIILPYWCVLLISIKYFDSPIKQNHTPVPKHFMKK